MPSKEENILKREIAKRYKDKIIQSYRPDFLKKESTGNNLEIDLYFPDCFIGIEYQGAIHFKDVKRYGNDSDTSRYHDELKNEMVMSKIRMRMPIVEIFPTDLKGDVWNNIVNRVVITQEICFMYKHFQKARALELFLILCESKSSLLEYRTMPQATPYKTELKKSIKYTYEYLKILTNKNLLSSSDFIRVLDGFKFGVGSFMPNRTIFSKATLISVLKPRLSINKRSPRQSNATI